MKHYAGKITVRGTEFEVSVDDQGYFAAQLDGRWTDAMTTRQQLEDFLIRTTRVAAQTVRVPFRYCKVTGEGVAVLAGFGVAVHAANGNLIVEREGKRSQASYSAPLGTTLHELDDEGEAQWAALLTAERDAIAARKKFEEKHHFDLDKAVRAAIARKIEENTDDKD